MSSEEPFWGLITDAIQFAISLPVIAGITVMKAYSFLAKLLSRAFPWVQRWKERREKAELLITYEELARKREELRRILYTQTQLLEDLISRIKRVDSKAFERRRKGESAESVMRDFNSQKLLPYQKIKETAVDYENTLFKIFVVCEKLELYGINRGVKQFEETEE